MSVTVPRFPLVGDPGEWDELSLCAATVFLEAEGEPEEGQRAVAWVIRNRMNQRQQEAKTVILAEHQFSCWNLDYRPMAEARLAAMGMHEPSWKAAAGALWALGHDPTDHANHYLNPELTRRIRKGQLPAWADPARKTATIGRHDFYRL